MHSLYSVLGMIRIQPPEAVGFIHLESYRDLSSA